MAWPGLGLHWVEHQLTEDLAKSGYTATGNTQMGLRGARPLCTNTTTSHHVDSGKNQLLTKQNKRSPLPILFPVISFSKSRWEFCYFASTYFVSNCLLAVLFFIFFNVPIAITETSLCVPYSMTYSLSNKFLFLLFLNIYLLFAVFTITHSDLSPPSWDS